MHKISSIILLIIPLFAITIEYDEDYWTDWIIQNHKDFTKAKPLWDGTRPDFMYHGQPGEVDWAHRKWMEAFGQSAWYAKAANTKPVIVLLVKDLSKEENDLLKVRALQNCLKYEGSTFIIMVFDCKSRKFIDSWDHNEIRGR